MSASPAALRRPAGFDRVVIAAGHLTDTPDRDVPRFPEHAVPSVERRMADTLDRWTLGPTDLLICGGARGADILAAELARQRQATVWLLLAHEPDVFERTSVAGADAAWVERYWHLVQRCPSWVRPGAGRADEGAAAFAATNRWIVQVAHHQSAGRPLQLVAVWDGRPAHGGGGTAELVALVTAEGGKVEVIDPTTADQPH